MFNFFKQPGETVNGIGIDFTTRFPAGTTIVDHTVSCATAGIVTASRVSGMQVLATLAAGQDGQQYKVTFTATGNDGSTRQAEIMLAVREL